MATELKQKTHLLEQEVGNLVLEEFILKLIILSYMKQTISAALFFLSMAAEFLKILILIIEEWMIQEMF